MERVLQKFQDLKIQLEEITSATNNFDDQNRIGVGGFGRVYKGEVSHSKGQGVVAIKRLDRRLGQGESEFLKEIDTLSRYRHENLISLLGFCYQGGETLLVYELASHGSLDKHLDSADLTWSQRIKICLGAAKGLCYLHDPRGTHQRLIHCDVKGGNILLDDQWNAKIADFGFSMMGPANEQQSTVITLAAGTHGYIDPLYRMTNTLTKESDVYSLGVVLFEVLCGRLCSTLDSDRRHYQILVPTWIESYKQKKLNDIIFKIPSVPPLDQFSLKTFSDIAYRCLNESREARPKMAEVVKQLQIALESQELLEIQELEHREFKGEWNKRRSYYEKITRSAEPPLNYASEGELMKLLCEGVLLNGGKTWFSLNKKGEHCEMISVAECLDSASSKPDKGWRQYNSRFDAGTYRSRDGKFKTRVKTQFLSPGITYTVNFVFKFAGQEVGNCEHIGLMYKLQGDAESSVSHLAYKREDGWSMAELYQFTCDHRIVDLEILFDPPLRSIEAEGIEFQPLEKVEHNDGKQPISDSDANWEEKLPVDYENIMKRSKNRVKYATKEEAYASMRKGFLVKYDQRNIWFSLDKNGKKCHMLSARASSIMTEVYPEWLSFPESRFGEAIRCCTSRFYIETSVQYQLPSSKTSYASYLVYKLPKGHTRFEAPVSVYDRLCRSGDETRYIYLSSPQTPVIRQKADQKTHNPPNTCMTKGLPQQRNDGWMEVQIWEFEITANATNVIPMSLCLEYYGNNWFRGMIIEGFEFRPI